MKMAVRRGSSVKTGEPQTKHWTKKPYISSQGSSIRPTAQRLIETALPPD